MKKAVSAELPEIRALPGPNSAQKKREQISKRWVWSSLLVIDRIAEITPYNPDELDIVLSYKIATSRVARKRAETLLGRFFNRCAGEDPDYVQMPGAHLKQILEAADLEAPEDIDFALRYHLRFDIALEAMQRLEAKKQQ